MDELRRKPMKIYDLIVCSLILLVAVYNSIMFFYYDTFGKNSTLADHYAIVSILFFVGYLSAKIPVTRT